MVHDDESSLLSRLQAGDPGAYEQLVREHGPTLRQLALRMVRSQSDADDVLQDAFLNAFKALRDFRGDSRLGTWLHRIPVNAALMRLRKQKRAREVELDPLLPEFSPTGTFARHQTAWGPLPEDKLDRELLYERVRECIEELPDKFRIPLLLRDVDGLDNAEVARRLGLRTETARVRVHRARQALRTLIHRRQSQRTAARTPA